MRPHQCIVAVTKYLAKDSGVLRMVEMLSRIMALWLTVDNGAFNTLANINVAVPNGKEKKSLDPSLLAITSLPVLHWYTPRG